MSNRTLFIEVVTAAAGLPPLLREHASEVTGLEEHRFDQSYIEFLDTQIRLNPRSPEWTERLKRRRAALLTFCGITFLHGRVQVGEAAYAVEIDPAARAVIHWELYDHGASARAAANGVGQFRSQPRAA